MINSSKLLTLLLLVLFIHSCSSFDAAPNRGKSNNGGNEANQDDISNVIGTYQGTITVSGQSAVNFVLTIDETDGSSKVEGFNIAAGNKRPVKGFCKIENSEFVFTLNEPGDNKTDGSFVIRLEKTGLVYEGSGTWTGYKNGTKAEIKLSSNSIDITPQWISDLPPASALTKKHTPYPYPYRDEIESFCSDKELNLSIEGLIKQMPKSYEKDELLSSIRIKKNHPGAYPFGLCKRMKWENFECVIIFRSTESEGFGTFITYDNSGNYLDHFILYGSGFPGGGSFAAFIDKNTIQQIDYSVEFEGNDIMNGKERISKLLYMEYTIERSGYIKKEVLQKGDKPNADYTTSFNKLKANLGKYK